MESSFSPRFASDHDKVQQLVPWFVTGQLSPQDRSLVVDHLAACEDCRGQVEEERALRIGVKDAAIDVDHGWERMRRRIASPPPPRARAAMRPRASRLMQSIVERPRAVAFVIAAQAALVVAAVALPTMMQAPPAYHALGADPAPAAGNVIVMLRPDANVGEVAAAMNQSGARIVDGPTSAGAFLVAVPPERRAAAVTLLRAQHAFTMAEPIDP